MKYVIASDIHGSAYYCGLLKNFYLEKKADKLVLLGDLLYHGARNALPKDYSTLQTAEILNSLKEDIICVRGNCDSEVDQMVLEFPILTETAYLDLGGKLVTMTHGHKVPTLLKKTDYLLNGHFHVPKAEQREDCFYLNSGSVSIPKENSYHSCILADGNKLSWYDLETGNVFLEYTL